MLYWHVSQICSQNIMWCKVTCLESLKYSINSTSQTCDFKFWNQVCLNVGIINPLRLPLVVALSFNGNLCKFFSFSPALGFLDKWGYSGQGMKLAVISSGSHGELHPVRFTFKNELITGLLSVNAVKNCKQTGKFGADILSIGWRKCFK